MESCLLYGKLFCCFKSPIAECAWILPRYPPTGASCEYPSSATGMGYISKTLRRSNKIVFGFPIVLPSLTSPVFCSRKHPVWKILILINVKTYFHFIPNFIAKISNIPSSSYRLHTKVEVKIQSLIYLFFSYSLTT